MTVCPAFLAGFRCRWSLATLAHLSGSTAHPPSPQIASENRAWWPFKCRRSSLGGMQRQHVHRSQSPNTNRKRENVRNCENEKGVRKRGLYGGNRSEKVSSLKIRSKENAAYATHTASAPNDRLSPHASIADQDTASATSLAPSRSYYCICTESSRNSTPRTNPRDPSFDLMTRMPVRENQHRILCVMIPKMVERKQNQEAGNAKAMLYIRDSNSK